MAGIGAAGAWGGGVGLGGGVAQGVDGAVVEVVVGTIRLGTCRELTGCCGARITMYCCGWDG